VCSLVLPPQSNGLPNRNDLGTLHVYRDRDAEMVSVEIVTDAITKQRSATARKEKRGDIVKLCMAGYEFAVMSDLPASIPIGDSTKRASASDNREDDESSISLVGIEIPSHFGEANADHAKAAWGLNQLPTNFSIIRSNGVYYGNIVGVGTYYNTNGFYKTGVRPAGTTTQWLSFNATPSALTSSGDHIAIALFFTSSAVNAIIGNGMIIGNNQGYPGGQGCSTTNTQIEAFWQTGNAVYGSTCAPFSVPDGISSSYVVHANMYKDVMYQRTTSGQQYTGVKNTAGQQPPTTSGGFNPNEGGILIGAATFSVPGNPNYSVQFTNVSNGWF
jgi:hypothetical protein